MSGFVRKTDGFSLLEIVVAVCIMVLLAAIVVPRLKRRPVALQKEVLRRMNNLTRTAQLNALITGKLHRILFDLKKKRAQVEVVSDKRDSQGALQFLPLHIAYNATSAPLPPEIEFEKFLIKGKNILQQGEGIAYKDAWFYIVPSGLSQEVTLMIYDQSKRQSFSLLINPFTAQFSLV